MSTKLPSLSILLTIDAMTCALMAVVLLIGAIPLGILFHLPNDLLRYAGTILVIFAALLGLAGRSRAPATWALALIFANIAWVIASVSLLASGAVHPSEFGVVFVCIQAGAVAIITGAEIAALRSPPVPV